MGVISTLYRISRQLIALNTSIASVAGNGVVPDPIQRRDMAALKAEIKTLSAKASDPSAVSVKYLQNGVHLASRELSLAAKVNR